MCFSKYRQETETTEHKPRPTSPKLRACNSTFFAKRVSVLGVGLSSAAFQNRCRKNMEKENTNMESIRNNRVDIIYTIVPSSLKV